MISYESYYKIRLLRKERGLSFNQISADLGIDPQTVARYARMESFLRRQSVRRASKLDAFKPLIKTWLETHACSTTQIFQRLCAGGQYTGGFSSANALLPNPVPCI